MSQNYSLCQVAENNGRNGKPLWIIVKGVVYDMTEFVKEHPGGEENIREFAGKDATKAFSAVGHSTDAIREMKLYKVGVVQTCTEAKAAATAAAMQSSAALKKQCESEAFGTQTQKKKRIKLFFCF